MSTEIGIYLWLGLTILFGLIEAATVGLTSIWFAAGALAAMIAAAFSANIWVQLIVFALVSALLLIFTRPLVRKFLTPKLEATNADALIGQTALVIEEIDNDRETGAARIDGKVWSARSADGSVIETDQKGIVVRIEGVKLILRAES